MISDYLLFLILGPRMAQGLNALGIIESVPALVRLCSNLSSIDVGNYVPISDSEIRAGLDELKSLLDMRVDSRHDIDERQKQLAKQGNRYLVDGLYRDVIASLLQRGYNVSTQ